MGIVHYLVDPEKLESFELGKSHFTHQTLEKIDGYERPLESALALGYAVVWELWGPPVGDYSLQTFDATSKRVAKWLEGRDWYALQVWNDAGDDEALYSIDETGSVYTDVHLQKRASDFFSEEEVRRYARTSYFRVNASRKPWATACPHRTTPKKVVKS